MKTIKFFIVLATILLSINSYAQSAQGKSSSKVESASFKVWGNCEMCKERIDKAAELPGVVSADWNQKTKILNVSYVAGKTSTDAIQKSIAAAGHDTEKYTGDLKAYNVLPKCCKYDRKK